MPTCKALHDQKPGLISLSGGDFPGRPAIQVYSDATADQIAAIAEAVKRRCPVASTLASMQRSLKVGDRETFRKYPSNYV